MDIFNIQDLSSEFSTIDVIIVIALSFLLSAFIGFIYQKTHRGASYTQSFVFSLVLNGMVVALIMMIVGSSIARAFSLVGALSIIRFRNAVKETRDVGFIFFSMAIGMAVGTQFYLLALVGTLAISMVILLMNRLNWFSIDTASHILRVQVPNDMQFDDLFAKLFRQFTSSANLISADTVQNGTLTELIYSLSLKKDNQVQDFMSEIKKINHNHHVSLMAGYNGSDL